MSIFFLIAGLYMVFQKEIKISSKRSIKGHIAQKVGLVFIIPALLSFVSKTITNELLASVVVFIIIAGYAGAIISIFYFIFFYKPKSTHVSLTRENIVEGK